MKNNNKRKIIYQSETIQLIKLLKKYNINPTYFNQIIYQLITSFKNNNKTQQEIIKSAYQEINRKIMHNKNIQNVIYEHIIQTNNTIKAYQKLLK